MALQWKWTDKMGKAIIRQDERKYEIGIYGGNALAIFISEDKDSYQLTISLRTKDTSASSKRTSSRCSTTMW